MLTNIQTQHHQETPVKKIRRSKLLWQGIIKKYEASGLSQQAFCTQQGLALSSFYKWRKTLKTDTDSEPPRIDDSSNFFVEVMPVDHEVQPVLPWDVELGLSNGMVLRLRHN